MELMQERVDLKVGKAHLDKPHLFTVKGLWKMCIDGADSNLINLAAIPVP